MKFSSFLFFQIFTLTTSDLTVQVRRVISENNVENIDYNPETRLDHGEIYTFLRKEDDRYDLIYWVGALSTKRRKVYAAYYAGYVRNYHENLENLYIRRETSKPGINTFGDVISAKVPEKIPRLYKVAGAHAIRQVPLKSDLNKDDSHVLDDGLSVTVYHSPTCETKRKIADSLAAYIINVENGGNYELILISSSDDGKNSETVFETFCDEISRIVKVRPESKTDVLPKSDEGTSKAAKKKNKAKNKNTTKAVSEEDKFKILKMMIMLQLQSYILPTRIDSSDFLNNDRGSNSATTSTSTVPTRKKSKAAKGKTSSKITKKSSLIESKSTDATTTSTATESTKEYENLIPIFMGSTDCVPKPHPLPIDSLKVMCIYSLKDLENYEIFIYLGKKVDRERQQMALGAAELDIDENSKWKLTTVLPGNKIPTAFMIHIKSEIKKYLLGEN